MELRRVHGMTQQQLSDRTGLSIQHVSHIENGNKEACLLAIGKLADAFGIDLSELLSGVTTTRRR